ncbi:hypothetical protein CU098_005776 [Rhizopus stolonifer]|uniref:Uncharacterized protein n=2 Tax=Mucorineae TaxID=1344963 RepID=A0A367KLQ1_RHIST|nr:hypothetical protein CU098_005776 [Rhizopus stolonifer]
MLQEYPTQIQPRSSSTRKTQDVVEQQVVESPSNTIDAEASRILIDLANQDTTSLNSFSLPIKTEANLHNLEQERFQPDPIMLLAAAAAVIDDEGNYKGRLYERREIKLHGRQASLKRKSFTYGSNGSSSSSSSSNSSANSNNDIRTNNVIHRRHSERRHRYHQRASVSEKATPENIKGKQNPRIKRNAMHAYITYMIYTDMAHEQQRRPDSKALYNNNNMTSTQHHHFQQKYNKEDPHFGGLSSSSAEWYNKQQLQQSYRLPPSPRQRHDLPPPPTESIIGRPLTDFLFERNKPSLLPPPSASTGNTSSFLGPRVNTNPTPPPSNAFYD